MKNKKMKKNSTPRDLDFVQGKSKVIDLRRKSLRQGRPKTENFKDSFSMENSPRNYFFNAKTEALADAFFKAGDNEAADIFLPNCFYKPPAFSDQLAHLKPPSRFKNKLFLFFKRVCDKKKNIGTITPAAPDFSAAEIVFLVLAIVFALSVWSLNLVEKSFGFEKKISETGISAFSDLALAAGDISKGKILTGSENFKKASEKFSMIEQNMDKFGGLAAVLDYAPLPRGIESKRALLKAGKNLSAAGIIMLEGVSNIIGAAGDLSLDETYGNMEKTIAAGIGYLEASISDLEKVDLGDVPEKDRAKFVLAKEKLPALRDALKNLTENGPLAMKILGMDASKKYLLLFENNHEIRAGGGFIGTYGLMEMDKGKIVNFFIDDIYNPDGQLSEKIIPPRPVQRISDAWSMHDANWFADFPASAKKVASFYEKTGGPTVDGVIAATPALIIKLLEMTGPIDMEQYGKTVDADNFMEVAQYEVEINYDKELNHPKKFLADLWKEMEGKIINADKPKAANFLETLSGLLREKQILIYSRDGEVQKFILKNGWGGQLAETDGDFLSVVNSNLGGYKTDGVINEEIKHISEIGADGSIIDTVEITRYHLGGATPYDWWNKVNVDYLRVYVPLGSQLLEAKGHTWEKAWREDHPFDYSKFKTDPEVEKIEKTIFEDKNTGTQIFEETGKTVFGNWVFASPGESATVTYKYKLPFKSDFNREGFSKYNLYVQKQAGSKGSRFEGKLVLPADYKINWLYPPELDLLAGNIYRLDANLAEDKVYGIIFQNK